MVSRPKAVTDGFMCVAVHPCRVNKTIRIVLLTLQGCTTTHMKPSVTAFGLDTIQAGVGEDNFHNLYLIANSNLMEPLIWAGFLIENPSGLAMWSQKMCAGSQASLNSRSSTS